MPGANSPCPTATTIRSSTTTSTGPWPTWPRSSSRTAAEADHAMLEELKEELIVNKVGGRFKLSTLIQKRMIALNQGSRPLIDGRGLDKMSIVIQEIMQDKIFLDLSGNLQVGEPTEEDEGGTVDLTQPSE